MICQRGRVVALKDGWATIVVTPGKDCATCASGRGCGGALVSGWLPRAKTDLRIQAKSDWRLGQMVTIKIDPRVLLTLALLGYGLPLCGLLLGMLAADGMGRIFALSSHDALVALGGFLGLWIVLRQGRRVGHLLTQRLVISS